MGGAAALYYLAGGSSDDWVYSSTSTRCTGGLPLAALLGCYTAPLEHSQGRGPIIELESRFAYTIELPDDGRQHGFQLPADRLPEVAQDTWVALRSQNPETYELKV